jgi:hypothetical protein
MPPIKPKPRSKNIEHALSVILSPDITVEQIGESFREYVREAHHLGMPGFQSSDLTGIWRFLDDVATSIEVDVLNPMET